MNKFKKEPQKDWLINLNKHRIVPLPSERSENIAPKNHPAEKLDGKNYKGQYWRGPWYAEYGADGILAFLFEFINDVNKFAIDIGASSGWGGSNIRHLADKNNWKSTELDKCGNPGKFGKECHPRVMREEINASNVIQILEKYKTSKNIDLLSIDIDSMDWYVLKAMLKHDYKPNVIMLEFNPMFKYDESYVVQYSEDFTRNGSIYGASLLAFTKMLKSFDYTLVNVCYDLENKYYDNNAIFLNNNLIEPHMEIKNITELHPESWIEPWKSNKGDIKKYFNKI